VKPYAWRDRFVISLANLILRLSTKRCQAMIKGSIKYGLLAATVKPGDPLPPLPESVYPPGAGPLEDQP
jgi:hypothetical protein